MENHTNDGLYGNFSQILDYVKKLISEFESISDNKIDIKVLPSAEFVYMQAIILNLAKLLSATSHDKLGIKQFLKIGSKENDEQITKIQNQYKEIIEKINANRSRIIAHLDENFTTLCFSEEAINEMEKNIEKVMKISAEEAKNIYVKLPRSTSKKQERYTPIDIKNDLPKIKEMLKQMDEIWRKVLVYDYSKKNNTEINFYPKNVDGMVDGSKFL